MASREKPAKKKAPEKTESISLGARLALYKETANICGIQANTNRCHFYLAQGARMADKDGLLEGTGKGTRHVKCYPGDEIPEAAIKRLIREGRKLAKG